LKINSLIKDFEQRLHNPILSKAVEHSNRQDLQQAYAAIKEKWNSSILIIIDNYTQPFMLRLMILLQI